MYYSKTARQSFIEKNLAGRYGWTKEDLENGSTRKGWPLRRISDDVSSYFGRAAPSPATISKDIKDIYKNRKVETSEEALDALDFENFPAWRSENFIVPDTGLPYETPEHQHHWFRVTVSFALKTQIPEDTMVYLELPAELNEKIAARNYLLSLLLLAPPRHGKTELSAIYSSVWFLKNNPLKNLSLLTMKIFWMNLNLNLKTRWKLFQFV